MTAINLRITCPREMEAMVSAKLYELTLDLRSRGITCQAQTFSSEAALSQALLSQAADAEARNIPYSLGPK